LSVEKKEKRAIFTDNYVAFIDVLFAVVIGQSFVLLLDKDYYKLWFAEPFTYAFGIFTIFLVYALVISSWVGYHQSIKAYPIQSIWRFFIDVILLFLYYLAFASASNFGMVLFVLFTSFFAYSIWDGIRLYELRNELTNELWKRLVCTIVFFGFFVAIFFSYDYVTKLIGGIEFVYWLASVILLGFYRYVKWNKMC